MNVQVPLSLFSETDPGLADRIQWVHGNLYVLITSLYHFPCLHNHSKNNNTTNCQYHPPTHHRLRQKLPFDDDEFDYVHIHGLAFAVPEPKVRVICLLARHLTNLASLRPSFPSQMSKPNLSISLLFSSLGMYYFALN